MASPLQRVIQNTAVSQPADTVSLQQQTSSESDVTFWNVATLSAGTTGGAEKQVLLSAELAQRLMKASSESLLGVDGVQQVPAQQQQQSGDVSSQAAAAAVQLVDSTAAALLTDSSTDSSDVTADGCARTDLHRNHVMCEKVRKRRMLLKQKAADGGFDFASFQGKTRLQSSDLSLLQCTMVYQRCPVL